MNWSGWRNSRLRQSVERFHYGFSVRSAIYCVLGYTAFVALALTLLTLTGCATYSTDVPAQFLLPRPIPEYTGTTYRDMAAYCIDLRELAQASEADKQAIREALE